MNTEFKGTQGDWEIEASAINEITIAGEDGDICCIVADSEDDLLSEIEWANAKIIASSPKLLEALIDGVKLIGYLIEATPTGKTRNTMCDFNIIAQSAINKALGKQ